MLAALGLPRENVDFCRAEVRVIEDSAAGILSRQL
jgi:hypothetical protein